MLMNADYTLDREYHSNHTAKRRRKKRISLHVNRRSEWYGNQVAKFCWRRVNFKALNMLLNGDKNTVLGKLFHMPVKRLKLVVR